MVTRVQSDEKIQAWQKYTNDIKQCIEIKREKSIR